MKSKFKPLQNQQGSVVITTMVIISVVLVIFSGIVSFKLTDLSRQSAKVNEAYQYLNVMEEMGMLIARSREIGRSSGGTCPAGTYIQTVDTRVFCLPSYNASGTLDSVCITNTSQKDSSGNSIRYCLEATDGLDTSSLDEGQRHSNVADATFNIVPVKIPSMLERAVVAMLTPLHKAHAACPSGQDWYLPCAPDNNNTPGYDGITNESSIAPVGYTTAPAGTGTSSSNTYASRNNLDTFAPTLASWAITGTNNANEIYTPSCDVANFSNQYWLGCMSCADANVLCVEIKMCPPSYTGTTSCARPYSQRIALYPDDTL